MIWPFFSSFCLSQSQSLLKRIVQLSSIRIAAVPFVFFISNITDNGHTTKTIAIKGCDIDTVGSRDENRLVAATSERRIIILSVGTVSLVYCKILQKNKLQKVILTPDKILKMLMYYT